MDIRQVTKMIGPVVLNKTEVGKRLVLLVNEQLPPNLHLSLDNTGEEALGRIDRLPDEHKFIVDEVNVLAEGDLEVLKKQIKRIKREEGISTSGNKRYLVIGSSLIFLLISLAIVFSYVVATINGTQQTDATVLLKVLDIVTEVLKQAE